MTTLSPITQTTQLVNPGGFITPVFKTYNDQLLNRVGGIKGGSYGQITARGGILQWDLDKSPIAVSVLTGNITLEAINALAGFLYPYRLTLVQDGTGGRLLSFGAGFVFPSGIAPALSTAPNSVDFLMFVSDGTNIYTIVYGKDMR